MLNLKNLTAFTFLSTGLIHAHLVLGSLSPMGGETLAAGETVTISWSVETPHQKGFDLALSKDGGKIFSNFKVGSPDTENKDTFKWTVPNEVTTMAKLRVCQSGPCSDAMNASKPGGNNSPWYLVSGIFTIQAAAGITTPSSSSNPLSLDFNPSTHNLDAAFTLTETTPVSLQAFDTQGRLAATLLQGTYASGTHNLSVFSNQLGASSGSLVFKLQVGNQVKTHSWLTLR